MRLSKEAVKAGIRKLNVATDVCYAFLDCVQEEVVKPDRTVAVDNFMKKPIEAVKVFAETKIKLVGAEGKGKIMSKVVGIGACVMDTLITVPHYPTEDTKLPRSIN